jgi:hypothetical protein
MPLLVSLWLLAQPQALPEPRITRAERHTHAIPGSLEPAFRALVKAQQRPAWIAYIVPRAERGGDTCLWEHQAPAAPTVMLEGARHAVILFRVERAEVTRIRAYAADCELDAGDLPLHWLTGVRASESIRLLDSFTQSVEASRFTQPLAASAIYAMGAHADPRALDLLIVKARTAPSPIVRRAAFSAIGRLRDPKALAFLDEVLIR